MEGFNSFEYSAEQKCEGKWAVYKLLLILGYIAFAAAYFTVIFITRIIPLGALIPFFLWILIFLTWRYISPDYQYTVEAGVFSFYIHYSSKKKSKAPRASLKISDAEKILPAGDADVFLSEFKPLKIYSAVPSRTAENVYVIFYKDGEGIHSAIYFVAMPDALRLLRLYNSAAMTK